MIHPWVLVIIVNWNTRDLLRQSLEALYRHPPAGPFEVIVVDNASEDGSASMVEEQFPQVTLLQNEENLGFARACNQAASWTDAPYLLFLNPDCFVQDGTVDILLDFLERTPRAALAGPRLLNADGCLQPSAHPFPTLSREFWRLFHLDGVWPRARYPERIWRNGRPCRVEAVQGACVLVRRAALPNGPPFDGRFFMYTEEVDLCYHVHRAGWETWWVPEAVAVHLGGGSTRRASLDMFLQLYRSKVLFFRKHYGQPVALAYKILLGLAALTRILLAPLFALVQPARRTHLQEVGRRYGHLLRSLAEM